MQIEKLKLTNFLSHADTEVDFTRLGSPALIVGRYADGAPGESNGSGKSAIFEAIIYSLFGESRADTDDGLVRLGAEVMGVTMIFLLDGVRYEIVRHKKRGKSQTVSFSDLTNDKKLRGNSVKETEMKIVDVLGMDYTVFTNTVFSNQDQLAVFPEQIPSKRKEVLGSILELDAYVLIEEKAKGLASGYERDAQALDMAVDRSSREAGATRITDDQLISAREKVDVLGVKVGSAQATLSGAEAEMEQLRSKSQMYDRLSRDIFKSQEDLARIAKQIVFQDASRVDQLAKIEAEGKSLNDQIAREPRLQGMIAEIEAKVRSYDEVSRRLSAVREERSGLGAEKDGLRRQMESSSADLDKLRRRLQQVQELGPRCPTCYSELTPEAQKKIADDIIAEGQAKRKVHDDMAARLQAIEARVKEIDREVSSLASDVDQQGQLQRDLTRAQTELAQVGWARTQMAGLDQRRVQVAEMHREMVAELVQEKGRVEGVVAKAQTEILGFTFKPEELRGLEVRISIARAEVQELSRQRDVESQGLGSLTALRESHDRLVAQIETDQVKLKETRDQEFVYRELTRAFGKNGIPALIMDNALAEIQAEVNVVMDQLTGGRISVRFQTQKEGKTGKIAETLDIVVADASGARDFRFYSGGEKARIALALRLALSRVISRRAGKRIECVMIDEIAGLDPAGVATFSQMINRISKDYKQILVVTHLTELQSQFQNVLAIVKDRDGSHVETEHFKVKTLLEEAAEIGGKIGGQS